MKNWSVFFRSYFTNKWSAVFVVQLLLFGFASSAEAYFNPNYHKSELYNKNVNQQCCYEKVRSNGDYIPVWYFHGSRYYPAYPYARNYSYNSVPSYIPYGVVVYPEVWYDGRVGKGKDTRQADEKKGFFSDGYTDNNNANEGMYPLYFDE